MMDPIEKQWIPISTYDSVRIDEYNGKWSLQLGKRGDNDTYTAWTCPQKWVDGEKSLLKKNGEPIFVPLSIPLGDSKEKALKVVGSIYNQLKAMK